MLYQRVGSSFSVSRYLVVMSAGFRAMWRPASRSCDGGTDGKTGTTLQVADRTRQGGQGRAGGVTEKTSTAWRRVLNWAGPTDPTAIPSARPARVFSSIRMGWPSTLVCASRWAARFTVSPTPVEVLRCWGPVEPATVRPDAMPMAVRLCYD